MAMYLGFDASTQRLTATIIDVSAARRAIVFEHALDFDGEFPEYGTTHGVLRSADGTTVTAPPRLWAAALERMARVLARSGVDLAAVRAVSGSAQQHGSVYLAGGAGAILRALDPGSDLQPQIERLFTRDVSPVWLDCSTSVECAALTSALGGSRALAQLTGSRAYERFTAAQIRKFAAADPDGYARTEQIHLVSSFMASLLCGTHAPLEPGDASGMNLMDIASRQWAPAALDATAPDLRRRLPEIRDSSSVIGVLSPFWQERFGLGPAKVVAWSGDNPSSLVGLGLIARGEIGISLGTSDTVFAPTLDPAPDPGGSGHVFGSPTGDYMALTCFANGSLARERVRDSYALDWQRFSAHLRGTAPGNGAALMLPWFVPEITPAVAHGGPHRRGLDARDAARNVRAIVEAQAMAMRLHSQWFAPSVSAIRATGGAAANIEILQVIADVFGADVVRIAPSNAASLGAALRAYQADRLSEGQAVAWRDVVAGFTDPDVRVRPRPGATAAYARLLPQYEIFERHVRAEAGAGRPPC